MNLEEVFQGYIGYVVQIKGDAFSVLHGKNCNNQIYTQRREHVVLLTPCLQQLLSLLWIILIDATTSLICRRFWAFSLPIPALQLFHITCSKSRTYFQKWRNEQQQPQEGLTHWEIRAQRHGDCHNRGDYNSFCIRVRQSKRFYVNSTTLKLYN